MTRTTRHEGPGSPYGNGRTRGPGRAFGTTTGTPCSPAGEEPGR